MDLAKSSNPILKQIVHMLNNLGGHQTDRSDHLKEKLSILYANISLKYKSNILRLTLTSSPRSKLKLLLRLFQ